jgi:hypothetical protein
MTSADVRTVHVFDVAVHGKGLSAMPPGALQCMLRGVCRQVGASPAATLGNRQMNTT